MPRVRTNRHLPPTNCGSISRILFKAVRRTLSSSGQRCKSLVGPRAEVAEAGATVEHSLEQLREQAAQLADRLQSEQHTLDRREQAVAAQEADLEAKWQNARHWLEERQQELEDRAESLAASEQQMAEREASAEARATELMRSPSGSTRGAGKPHSRGASRAGAPGRRNSATVRRTRQRPRRLGKAAPRASAARSGH